jgi:hypothetical protein
LEANKPFPPAAPIPPIIDHWEATASRGALLRGALGFIVGFVVVIALGRFVAQRWVRPPYLGELSERISLFEQAKDGVDVAIVGRSHLARGLAPSVIDRHFDARGAALASFNVSVSSLNLLEQEDLLQEIAALGPERVRWVVLEPLWKADFEERNLFTRRVLQTHDAERALTAIRYELARGRPLDEISRYVTAAAYHTLGVGALAVKSGRERWRPPQARRRRLLAQRGFLALDHEEEAYYAERSARFAHELPKFLRLRDLLAEGRLAGRDLVPLQLERQRALLDRARALGLAPIVVIPPNLDADFCAYARAHAVHFPETPLLSFNDPLRYPELFDPDGWFDIGHLNERGALAFSNALGEALADLIVPGAATRRASRPAGPSGS